MRILGDKKFKVEAGRVYPAGSGIKDGQDMRFDYDFSYCCSLGCGGYGTHFFYQYPKYKFR